MYSLPKRIGSALLLTALQGAPNMARAENPATITMARERFEEGVEFFDAGRFEEARAAFLQAYALKPHPAVLLNIAQSELRAGRHVDAATRFAEYLRDPEGEVPERSSAERGLREAKRHVGELRVEVDTEGAELFVDGQSAGPLPLQKPLFVAPGPHWLRVRQGPHSAHTRVLAEAAGTHDVELRLAPTDADISLRPLEPALRPPSPAVGTTEDTSFGTWLVSSPVGITGLVMTGTGLLLGTTGTIVATERYAAARDASRTIAVTAAEDDLGGAICESGSSDLAQYQRACSERQRRLNQGDTWRALAVGGFVGAAVVAAGTVAYYFLDSPSATPADTTGRTRIVPLATTEVRGISVVGTF